MTDLVLAKILHGATSQLPRMDGSKPISWDELTFEQRLQAVDAVRDVMHMLAHREMTPRDFHIVWELSAKENGWTYGEKYDPIKKTHPSLVDFSELSESEKFKDIIWSSLCSAAYHLME